MTMLWRAACAMAVAVRRCRCQVAQHAITAPSQRRLPLRAVAAGGRRRLAAMPNDTASQPRATVGEPAGLASCAQGRVHRCESHIGAGAHKARMEAAMFVFSYGSA